MTNTYTDRYRPREGRYEVTGTIVATGTRRDAYDMIVVVVHTDDGIRVTGPLRGAHRVGERLRFIAHVAPAADPAGIATFTDANAVRPAPSR